MKPRLQIVRRAWRLRLTANLVLASVILMAGVWPAQPAQAKTESLADGLLRAFAVLGSPKNIVSETSNRIWFTAPDADAIGLLTIVEISDALYAYDTRYYATGDGSRPYDLLIHEGAIWFTLAGAGEIGKLDIASGALSRYPLARNSAPHGLALRTSDATLWFVTNGGNTLGRFNLADSTIAEFPYPVANAGLEDVTFGSGGAVWLTASTANQIRLFDSATDTFELPVPTGANGIPISIAVDALNLPWVTFSETGEVSRYAPGTLALWRRFAVPMREGQPSGLYLRGDDFSQSVWYTLPATGAVGYFQTRNSGVLLTPHINFALPGKNSAPWGITVDADGAAWIADSGANQIVQWIPPYYELVYLPVIARQE